jgi:hypothetical protein
MKIPVKCRFANESTYTVVQLRKGAFRPAREFKDEVFGHLDDLYVAIDAKDWKIANEMWNYDSSTEGNIS